GAASSDGGRAQIIVRLFDVAACGRTVWAERSSFPLAKLAQWSELIAARVIAGIDPATAFFDGRPWRRNRNGADGLLLAAIPLMSSMERRKYEEAGRLINRALDFEPDNPRASAWAAFWQVLYFGQGWTQNVAKSSAIAQVWADRAISLNPDDPETLAI